MQSKVEELWQDAWNDLPANLRIKLLKIDAVLKAKGFHTKLINTIKNKNIISFFKHFI